MLGLALAASRFFGTAALIGLLSALTGCWDGSSTGQSVSAAHRLESISLSPPDTSLAAGLTQQLTATGVFSDGSKQNISSSVTWTSSQTAIASISGSGTATGLSSGPTTITAAAAGIAGTTTLTVTAAHLVSIGITPAAPTIALGTTETLHATGVYSDNSIHDVTDTVSWKSATPTVATVSSSGQAAGSGVGKTLVTASLGGMMSPAITLKVTGAALVLIAVTPAIATLANGTQQQFTATATFSDGSTQDVSGSAAWNSAASSVATIGSNGLANATGIGSASITAALGGVTSPAARLSVSAATLVSIAVTPAVPSLALGLNEQLTATGIFTDGSTQDLTSSVTWTSSATTVADISSGLTTSGLVTGHVVGSTNITATLGAVSSAPVALTVTAATLVSIGVTPGAPGVALGTGEQFTATGIYTDHSTQDLSTAATWVSSPGSVASISNAAGYNGLATALAVGGTTITAVLGSITSNPVTLTVTPATLVSIGVTPGAPGVALGTGEQFTATGIYTDHSTQDLTTTATWASSPGSVASISNAAGHQGSAIALAVGSTTITAAVGSVTSSPVTLTVTPATLVSIGVTPGTPGIALGTAEQFTATGIYTDNSTQDLTTTATWASSPGSAASISNAAGYQGSATALAVGSTTITAAVGSVTSSPITLTVTPATLVSIGVTPGAPGVALGTGEQFTATGIYTDNSTQDLTTTATWASSSVPVASISNAAGYQGLATSLTVGSTTITAVSGSITSNAVTLTVSAATLVSIAFTPAAPSIAAGTQQQFLATGTYTDNSTQDLTTAATWASSSVSVASISNAAGYNGVASALTAGSTTISAVSGSITSNPVTLTVSAATLVSIAVTPAAPSIAAGTEQQFIATGSYSDSSTQDVTTQVVWASDTPGVATISNASGSQGLASSAASGTAQISAMLGSVASAPITLTVTSATLVSLEFVHPPLTWRLGSTLSPEYEVFGIYTDGSIQSSMTSVTWTSSDTTVATISNAGGSIGVATVLTTGTTDITAAVGSITATTSLVVLPAI
jgi:trimeric autotransporter adhesin